MRDPAAPKRVYPTKAVVQRYLDLARENNIRISGFRVDPTTGAVEVFEVDRSLDAESPYEKWKREKAEADLDRRLAKFAE